MKRNIFTKTVVALSSLIICLASVALINVKKVEVKASSYIYDYFKNVVPSSEGLAYDLTYYSSTIKPDETVDPALRDKKVKMDNLEDMEVYNDKIYILNSSSGGVEFNLHNEYEKDGKTVDAVKMTLTNVGQITVINQQFQWEKIIDEFPFSQEVANPETGETIEDLLVKSLNDYYKFDTPLDQITQAQVTSTNLLDRAPYLPYTLDNSRHAIRLRSAEGVTVAESGIYIADTENSQILQLNFDFEVVNIFLTPNDTSFYQVSSGIALDDKSENGTLFRPTKVAVDVSGRVYAIAKDVYEGIIEFSRAKTDTRMGVFNRFLGKNEVVANPLKTFWVKYFYTEKQKQALALDLPPMFTNITMDSEGFLYATSLPDNDDEDGTTKANMVKAINTAGKDVMKRNGYVTPNGDATYVISTTSKTVVTGPSSLQAVAINNKMGIFTIVDNKRGRLFTYDMEGNLLYITGAQPGGTSAQGSGDSMANILVKPIAIDYFYRTYEQETIDENGNKVTEEVTEDLVLVLDNASQSLLIYKTTEFGKQVNLATSYYQLGEIEKAEDCWREVTRINTNYELAYLGIGKSVLRRAGTIEEYKQAMDLFETAHNAVYYSKAYSLYRDATMRKYFAPVMTVILVIVVGLITLTVYKKIKRKKLSTYDEGGDE